MKVGVTGGRGFIGTYIVEELVSRGHEVVIFDHQKSTEIPQNFMVSRMLGDVRDATAVTELAAHVDGIIHLAAVLGTQETIQNPFPAAETNILGSLNVFTAAAQYNVPVVYAGVGNHFMRLDGTGSYTISKSAAEDFARMFNGFRDGKISIVRPVNAYGPRQSIAAPYGTSKVRKIMPSLICRALVGDDIELYGGGSQISDCVYVEDVAYVFVKALEWTAINGPVAKPIEVGPVTSNTILETAEIALEIVGELMNLPRYQWSKIKNLPMRPGEVVGARVSADVSTLGQIGINAENFTFLPSGVRKTAEYYYENWLDPYLYSQKVMKEQQDKLKELFGTVQGETEE